MITPNVVSSKGVISAPKKSTSINAVKHMACVEIKVQVVLQFEVCRGLREVILAEKLDDLARQVIRKMLSYGLGRQLEYYDEPAVRKILATFKKDGYRMQTLVREVVKSYPFQFRKNPGEPDNESKKVEDNG